MANLSPRRMLYNLNRSAGNLNYSAVYIPKRDILIHEGEFRFF